MKRMMQMIGVKPECLECYKQLHKEIWPHIVERLKERNIQNYTISYLDGKLISYMEYVGEDYESDMKKPRDEEEERWQELCSSMQEVLPGCPSGTRWWNADEVFHMD